MRAAGEYFPGTGDVHDVGCDDGKNYAINFPLHDGMDDESFKSIFRPVIGKVIEVFRPGAVVMQCGADSLSGDRLGCFNLSLLGHADCVAYVRSFGIPMLVLGGGGYTLRNVPRVWTYETAVLLGVEIKDVLPYNDYFEYYGPDYRLHMPVSNMENLNSAEYLEHIKTQLFGVLDQVEPAPGVQIKADPSIGGPTGPETSAPVKRVHVGNMVATNAEETPIVPMISSSTGVAERMVMNVASDAAADAAEDGADDDDNMDTRPTADHKRMHPAEFYDTTD